MADSLRRLLRWGRVWPVLGLLPTAAIGATTLTEQHAVLALVVPILGGGILLVALLMDALARAALLRLGVL